MGEEEEMNVPFNVGVLFVIIGLFVTGFVCLVLDSTGHSTFNLAGGFFQIIGSLFLVGICLMFYGWRIGVEEE